MNWLNIEVFLALAAFVLVVVSAAGRAPLWAAVLLLSVLALIKVLPH